MKTPDLVLAPVFSDRNTTYQLAWHEAAEEHDGGAPLSVLGTRLEWMSAPTIARSTRQLVSRAATATTSAASATRSTTTASPNSMSMSGRVLP